MSYRRLFLGIAISLTAGVAVAQEPADTTQLDPVVVTATRIPQSTSRLSSSVTVLWGEDLRVQGIDHVLDALRSVQGLHVVQSGSFGSIASLFLRGGESNFVQVLADGVQLNEPGGQFDFSTLTTDNIERIEIVRGPGSALYGSDAMTGVVQIFTRDGRGPPRASVSVRGGTYGSWRWDGQVSGGAERAGYALSLSRFTTDGAYAFNNAHENTVFSGTAKLAPDERTDASIAVRYADNTFHFPTDGAGNLVDSNAFRFGDALVIGVNVGRFLTDLLEARVQFGIVEQDAGSEDLADGPADTLGFFGFVSQDDLRRTSADARFNIYAHDAVLLTVGGELEQETQRSVTESLSEFGNSSGRFEAERWNRGVYGQALVELGDVALNLGGRVEDNDQYGTSATFRGGTTYRIARTNTRFRASVGSGIKEPTFFEAFASGFVRGNPDLAPERSVSWEVGVEQTLPAVGLRFTGAFFDQHFNDLIQFTFVTAEPDDPNYFNIARASSRGVELGFEMFRGEFRAQLNYTYLDAEVVDAGFDEGPDAEFVAGNRLLRRPTHSLNAAAAYRFGSRGSASVDVNVVGGRDDLDFAEFPATRVELPPYVTVGLAGELSVVRPRGHAPGFAVTGRVENLFDEDYQEVVGFPSRGARPCRVCGRKGGVWGAVKALWWRARRETLEEGCERPLLRSLRGDPNPHRGGVEILAHLTRSVVRSGDWSRVFLQAAGVTPAAGSSSQRVDRRAVSRPRQSSHKDRMGSR
jgi:vitamin B12 transporter